MTDLLAGLYVGLVSFFVHCGRLVGTKSSPRTLLQMRPLGHRRGGNREAVDVLVASAEENRASPGSLWFMLPSPNAELDLGRGDQRNSLPRPKGA